ncbi:MAG: RNA polymerase sigma factor [Patescibacteria group bacterium]|nr:RNA polymerase sigma factor [Patescibacteria group bacterium]
MKEYKEFSDEAMIEKVRSEDQELYAVIISRYQDKLLRYAVNLTKNEASAADIVQTAFIKAFINLKGFNVKKKFSSWIYRIVHNEALNIIKKYQKETPILDKVDFKSGENIEINFERQEIAENIEKCFNEMPLLYAEPLRLHYIDEQSYEEISDILRLPIGTVATRISRAKILLKHICQKK